jgi:hypothetical protein
VSPHQAVRGRAGAEWSQPRGRFCRLQMLKERPGEGVESEVPSGVRARMESVWNSLGHARESVIEVQIGEVTSPAATTKGWGCPLIIAPGQNDKVPLCLMERLLPEETQATSPPR